MMESTHIIVRDAGFAAAYLGLCFPLVEVWSDYIQSHIWGNYYAGSDLESYLGPWLDHVAFSAYTPQSHHSMALVVL